MNNNSVQASTKKFSKREALSFAWKALIGNFGFLALIVFVALVLANIPLILYGIKHPELVTSPGKVTSIGELYSVIFATKLWVIIFTPVVFSVVLKLYDEQQLDFNDLIPDFKKVWKVFLLNLLFLLAYIIFCFLLGIILVPIVIMFNPLQNLGNLPIFVIIILAILFLLLIPIIYVALRLLFTCCFIVDRSNGPLEAIRESWALTKNNVANLFVLLLIFYIPMLWNLPLGMMRMKGLIKANLFWELDLLALLISGLVYIFVLLSIVYAYRKLTSSPEAPDAIE